MSLSQSTADSISPPSAPSSSVQVHQDNSAPHHVKEENDIPGNDDSGPLSSIISQNSSQTSSVIKKDIIKKNLMKLESSQTSFSRYPPGCMVHYNFNSPLTSQQNSTWNTRIISSFNEARRALVKDFLTIIISYTIGRRSRRSSDIFRQGTLPLCPIFPFHTHLLCLVFFC